MEWMLPDPVREALERLERAGWAAYTVGGCVRDRVLGMEPHDYDICTSAKPDDMKRVFAGEHWVETGLRHGTLTVILDHMPLEITTFRQDGEYLDGRHPASVRFTARVEEDLSRRDFTINAMAYSPKMGLIDPFGGREDCRRRLIRCVGEPERRFAEDALRILRALRFSSRLGFPIEPETARALMEGKERLNQISRERIAAELTGLLLGEHAGSTLLSFPAVIRTVLPGLSEDAWARTAQRVDKLPRDEILRWAGLLMSVAGGGEGARAALLGLKMPTRVTEAVSQLVKWQDAPLTADNMQEMLMRLGPERLRQLLLLQRANARAEGKERADQALFEKLDALIQENACCTLGQLAVNGRDAAGLGFRGEEIGRALNELLLRVVRGEAANDRETLLAELKKIRKG